MEKDSAFVNVKNHPIGFFKAIKSDGVTTEIQTKGGVGQYDPMRDQALKQIEQILVLPGMINKFGTDQSKWPKVKGALIVLRPGQEAELYLNEEFGMNGVIKVKVTQPIKVGEMVAIDQIKNIEEIEIENVDIGVSDGVICIFRVRERLVFWFDCSPLAAPHAPRDPMLMKRELASFYFECWISQDLKDFEHDNVLWEKFIQSGWYPFVSILGSRLGRLVTAFKNDQETDVEKAIAQEISKEEIGLMMESWWRIPIFEVNRAIIEVGVERFLANDWISSISVLLPRVEGILRQAGLAGLSGADQYSHLTEFCKRLSELADPTMPQAPVLTTLTVNFADYLLRNWGSQDLSKTITTASKEKRVHFAHGVATDFSKVRALKLILTLDHLANILKY